MEGHVGDLALARASSSFAQLWCRQTSVEGTEAIGSDPAFSDRMKVDARPAAWDTELEPIIGRHVGR